MKMPAGVIVAIFLGSMLSLAPGVKKTSENDEVKLGRKLFFDRMLSRNYSISCAHCHRPEFAFSDTVALSKGFEGRLTTRNAPPLTNLGERPYFFWDGREQTLEAQVFQPIQHPDEMGLSLNELNIRLLSNKEYLKEFHKVYGKPPSVQLAAKAIAAFESTLETGNSPFDRFMQGDSNAISKEAIAGREIFMGKAKCFDCHFSPDFTGDEFKNIGLFNGKKLNDSGRFLVSRKNEDLGKFRVPGLRNIALTAPYMHNGMFRTLNEVIDYYNNPDKIVPDAQNRDTTFLKPLGLTTGEKSALIYFLQSLTSPSATSR
jgi:cytochrome c peroxidase